MPQDLSTPDETDSGSVSEEESELRPSGPRPAPPPLRERSNSIGLELQEKEEKQKVLNVFGMRSTIQKWRHSVPSNPITSIGTATRKQESKSSKQQDLEPAFRTCAPTGKVLKKQDLEFCLKRTRFDEKTILFWFRSFRCVLRPTDGGAPPRSECPNGDLSRGHLLQLFSKVFPHGNAESFCDHIFR
jgi:hypothetical protein